MSQEPPNLVDSITSLPQRLAALVELVATLDLRVRGALEGLEEMRRSVAPLAEGLEEMRLSVAPLSDVMTKSDAVFDDVNSRLDRLEASIANIERATVHLDETFQSSLEALPDFVSKRIRPS